MRGTSGAWLHWGRGWLPIPNPRDIQPGPLTSDLAVPPSCQEYVAYSHTGRIIPAIWFRYDLSPITVKYTERRQPLYRFITTVSVPEYLLSPRPGWVGA